MRDIKKTPEQREIRSAVEQGYLGIIKMRKQVIDEATFMVAVHERKYQTTPAPIHAIVQKDLLIEEPIIDAPVVQPLHSQIQDTSVNISGRPDARIEEARRRVYEAIAA